MALASGLVVQLGWDRDANDQLVARLTVTNLSGALVTALSIFPADRVEVRPLLVPAQLGTEQPSGQR